MADDNPFLKYKQAAPKVSSDNPFAKYAKQELVSTSPPAKGDSPLQDVEKTILSMPERAAAGLAMGLPNLINTAFEGPQFLGRGVEENVDKLIGINPQPHGELWHPYLSSEYFLQSMPGALRPHTPTTTAGRVVELGGNIGGQIIGAKGMESAPRTGVPQAMYKDVSNKLKPIIKDESSYTVPGFKKSDKQRISNESHAEEKAQEHIVNTLLKAGNSPQEVLDIMERSKAFGLTVGEAGKNPELLGLESKISGQNRPGGKMLRDFAESRVDPSRNTSVQERLRAMADPFLAKAKSASDNIGKLVVEAPKTPLDMGGIRSALVREEVAPGTPTGKTLSDIQNLFDYAHTQGDTFRAWHDVKQELWNLKSEASNPNAAQLKDENTANRYYAMVNDVLSRRAPGLPDDLLPTGGKYAAQNDVYRSNLAGRTIKEVLREAPLGGTPAATLSHLYRHLVGSESAREALFGQMPGGSQKSMMKMMEAIKDAARGNLRDVSKSVKEGSASFPKSYNGLIMRAVDRAVEAITRKDYDALAKALTNPDLEVYARKLGTEPPKSGTTPPKQPPAPPSRDVSPFKGGFQGFLNANQD